jgi:hypothetical protein
VPKLKLNLDSLRVETFVTAATADARGTVHGHDATQPAETCGCVFPSDGCSIGCTPTYTCEGTEGPGCQNNPWTVIEW